MTGIQLVYTEKDIEDLLVEESRHYLQIKFIKRQFRTPVGIIDVVARHPDVPSLFYVIEIKKGAIDAAAYVQVLRYTTFLNSEQSKDGYRLFVPLLIGSSLSDDLTTLCRYFEPDDGFNYGHIGRVYYRLFNFNPKKGVAFTWQSTAEADYRDTLEMCHSHIESIAEHRDYLDLRLQQLTQPPAGPHLVKSGLPS